MTYLKSLIEYLKESPDMRVERGFTGVLAGVFFGLFLPTVAVIYRDALCADGSKNSDSIIYYPSMIIMSLISFLFAVLAWKHTNRIFRIDFDYKRLSSEDLCHRMNTYDDVGLIRLYRKLTNLNSAHAAFIERELAARNLVNKESGNHDKTAIIASNAFTNITALDAIRKASLSSKYIFVDAVNIVHSEIIIKLADIKKIQARTLLYFPPKIAISRRKALRIFFKKNSRLKKIDIFPDDTDEWITVLRKLGMHVEEKV